MTMGVGAAPMPPDLGGMPMGGPPMDPAMGAPMEQGMPMEQAAPGSEFGQLAHEILEQVLMALEARQISVDAEKQALLEGLAGELASLMQASGGDDPMIGFAEGSAPGMIPGA